MGKTKAFEFVTEIFEICANEAETKEEFVERLKAQLILRDKAPVKKKKVKSEETKEFFDPKPLKAIIDGKFYRELGVGDIYRKLRLGHGFYSNVQ